MSPRVAHSASHCASASAGSARTLATYVDARRARVLASRHSRQIRGATTIGRSGLKDGESDALANLGLVGEQVAEIHALENLVDPLLEEHPDRADAAVPRVRAPLLADRVRDTVEIEGRELGGRDDVA